MQCMHHAFIIKHGFVYLINTFEMKIEIKICLQNMFARTRHPF